MVQDLNSLGISALGPRRKILSAINELRNVPSTSQHMTAIKEGQKLSDSALPVTPVDTSQGITTLNNTYMHFNFCKKLDCNLVLLKFSSVTTAVSHLGLTFSSAIHHLTSAKFSTMLL